MIVRFEEEEGEGHVTYKITICFTLGLFANCFSLKSLSLFLKSHECALKLTYLRLTSLLFDLNYKFIDGSLALSPR